MQIHLDDTDIRTAARTAVEMLDDERLTTPNDYLEGAYTLKLLCRAILQGAYVIVPNKPALDDERGNGVTPSPNDGEPKERPKQ